MFEKTKNKQNRRERERERKVGKVILEHDRGNEYFICMFFIILVASTASAPDYFFLFVCGLLL